MDAVLVLSGGGNLGAVQAGMLESVLAAGIRPRHIVGSSVGALNGAFLAVDPTPERVEQLQQAWRSLVVGDVFAGHRLVGYLCLAAGRVHIHDPSGLRRLIRTWFEPTDLSQTAIPIHVATTELATGITRWWRAGDPVDILQASAAIPVVFPPVELGDVLHIDGAVVEPIGLERAASICDLPIVVLESGATAAELRPPDGPVSMVTAAVRAGRVSRLARDLDAVDRRRIIWLQADVPVLAYHDFSRTEELIDIGRKGAAEILAEALPAMGRRARAAARRQSA